MIMTPSFSGDSTQTSVITACSDLKALVIKTDTASAARDCLFSAEIKIITNQARGKMKMHLKMSHMLLDEVLSHAKAVGSGKASQACA